MTSRGRHLSGCEFRLLRGELTVDLNQTEFLWARGVSALRRVRDGDLVTVPVGETDRIDPSRCSERLSECLVKWVLIVCGRDHREALSVDSLWTLSVLLSRGGLGYVVTQVTTSTYQSVLAIWISVSIKIDIGT